MRADYKESLVISPGVADHVCFDTVCNYSSVFRYSGVCIIHTTESSSSLKAPISRCGITMHVYPHSKRRATYISRDMHDSSDVAHWLTSPVQLPDYVFLCREVDGNGLLELPANAFADLASLQEL